MVKRIFLVLVLLLFAVSTGFAVIKGLDKVSSPSLPSIKINPQELVKVGEEVVIPEAAEVKSVVSIGGPVVVYGEVKEDIVAIGNSIYLKENASVGGDVVSVGGKVDKEPRAAIGGEIVEVSVPGVMPLSSYLAKGGLLKGLVFFGILAFIGFIALTIILVAVLTPQLGRISAVIETAFWNSFWVGLLIAVLVVPIAVILAISVIGIVLIPVWVVLVLAAGLIGYIAAAHVLGKRVLYLLRIYGRSMMTETVVGVILLGLVMLVPVLGHLVKCIAVLCGLGAVYWTRFGTR
jgi:hypothetical protein